MICRSVNTTGNRHCCLSTRLSQSNITNTCTRGSLLTPHLHLEFSTEIHRIHYKIFHSPEYWSNLDALTVFIDHLKHHFMIRVFLSILIGICSAGMLLAQKQVNIYKIGDISATKKVPPPPPPFYFNNCSNPPVSGSFVKGTPTSATITLVYVNANGSVYAAFTSPTINGIKLTANGGTLTTGTGSITFTASGTPVNAGSYTIPVSIAGSITCNLPIAVLNAPPNPPTCTDPGTTPGNTGCVKFTYRGQQVTYMTVRAADGKVWLQQNLGSPQVPINGNDMASFGHYFQWGRWDDGGQVPNSPTITGSSTLNNPSHIASGNANFIKGTSVSTSWWGAGGSSSNTWTGATASATNGKDPCAALGAGWHVPSSGEWLSVLNLEWVFDNVSAFASNLKLTESGYRTSSNGVMVPNWVGGYYWTSDASGTFTSKNVFFDSSYPNLISVTDRGYGFSLRCVK